MEPTHAAPQDGEHPEDENDFEGKVDIAEQPKKVFPFSAPYKPWPPQSGVDRTPSPATPQRDWSAALDLVNEAYEAIRIAEERAAAAEDYSKQLTQYHSEQLRVADARLAAAEKRAEAAEARAREAEEWLVKFHDTILDGFQKTKSRG
jgi:hypothetical protein